MKRCLLLFQAMFIALTILKSQTPNTFFVSPEGDDTNNGLATSTAFANISHALAQVQAGDTIFLMPGNYYGTTTIEDKHGQPDQSIVIKSYSNDPLSYAVIDGRTMPSSTAKGEGFVLRNSSWINIEQIVFRNCWTHVIQLYDSPYITIRSCHFTTGKRVIHARNNGTHHVLVENCYIEHPEQVWNGWSWAALHHGDVSYYNGALLHPNQSGGGHIMRGCTLKNIYNVFRTRPKNIQEDGNTEIYNNTIINIRDNEFEPETWAWNMHYAYNRHVNIHKMYSIDGVRGGNIYIYGNTYTQSTDPWAMEEVSGIFKYSSYDQGSLTYPCYAFNNSYYTDARVLRKGESTNHQLKHFNNIYEFFEGEENFSLIAWQPGFEFDYDCINQDWPKNIYAHQQEESGLKNTNPLFVDGLAGDFHLQDESPCIDAGKVMRLPELDWVQEYEGTAPDMGAFDNGKPIDGPAFRFIPSPEGALYEEHPRISKHKVKKNQLWLYFSTSIAPNTLSKETIRLYDGGQPVSIRDISFPNHPYEMRIETDQVLNTSSVSIVFGEKPQGKNGLQMVAWGSSIPMGKHISPAPDLSQIPLEFTAIAPSPNYKKVKMKVEHLTEIDGLQIELSLDKKVDPNYVNHITIYTENGTEQPIYEPEMQAKKLIYTGKDLGIKPGMYTAKAKIDGEIYTYEFEIEK